MLFSILAVFTDNLIMLATFITLITILIVMLINIEKTNANSSVAKKTFIILGLGDSLFVLGIAGYFFLTNSMVFGIQVELASIFSYITLFCLMIAGLSKIGIVPFHSWITEMSTVMTPSVLAFLPATLDKLVGIYLLIRIVNDMFIIDEVAKMIILVIGSVSLIYGVVHAMFQKDASKLLAYHSISQAGYMVIGIGSGFILGIIGGLFHMLNNTLFKSNLFLSVEHFFGNNHSNYSMNVLSVKPKQLYFNKNNLFIYLIFTTTLISVLSINGIPPFNGFVSKNLINMGIKDAFQGFNIFLLISLISSSLTLASFTKFIFYLFLSIFGDSQEKRDYYPSTNFFSLFPQVILSLLCIFFGIFALNLPLKLLVLPALSQSINAQIVQSTTFSFNFIKILEVILGIVIGIYLCKSLTKKIILKDYLDLYEQGKYLIFSSYQFLSHIQNGLLHSYLNWVLLFMLLLLIVLR